MMVSSVASGRLRYPCMTLSPFRMISPTSPLGSSTMFSSTILISYPGIAGPTERSFCLCSGLMQTAGELSLSP